MNRMNGDIRQRQRQRRQGNQPEEPEPQQLLLLQRRRSCRSASSWLIQRRRRRRQRQGQRRSISVLPFVLLIFDWSSSLLPTPVFVRVVTALCHVEDDQGHEVKLSSLYPPPPYHPSAEQGNFSSMLVNDQDRGVHYDPEFNKLRCTIPNSCRKWKIQGCTLVTCNGAHSCQDATLVENIAVACWSYASCQNARLLGIHQVVCGVEGKINPCLQAILDVQNTVLCFGPYACAASDWEDRTTIRIGPQGFVRCQGSGVSTGDAAACQNMLIQVPQQQQYRACIATELFDTRGCAVVCQDPSDCDETTIQFEIVPV